MDKKRALVREDGVLYEKGGKSLTVLLSSSHWPNFVATVLSHPSQSSGADTES